MRFASSHARGIWATVGVSDMRFGRITDPAELAAYRLSNIPAACRATAQHVKCKTGDAEAWTWADGGKLYAVAYFGRSQHPYSGNSGSGSVYRFSSPERRRDWIAECFRRATEREGRRATVKAEKAAARATPHGLQVGDVLRSSWGYDQTNIDYYEITKLIGSQMVEYRRIGCQSEDTGNMSGVSVPSPGAYIGEPKRARVSDYGQRDSIKVSCCANAYRMAPTVVAGGVKVYRVSNWTAYA